MSKVYQKNAILALLERISQNILKPQLLSSALDVPRIIARWVLSHHSHGNDKY
jgi:hypothetical protein